MSTNVLILSLFSALLFSGQLHSIGRADAATHVNVSIEQNPADVKYVDGKAPAELRAGPGGDNRQQSDFSYTTDTDNYHNNNRHNRHRNYEMARSAQLRQPTQTQQQRQFYDSQRHQQYKEQKQEKQNQEFERYIQNFHSGPTVETVFESSTPTSSQRQQSKASGLSAAQSERIVAIGSRPAQVHTFERQVALPTTTATLLPASDADYQTHAISNHQPKAANEVSSTSSSSESVAPSPSSSSSSSSGGPAYDRGSSDASPDSGYDQFGFDQGAITYNKPVYDDGARNHHSYDADLEPQYPPAVDESAGGAGAGMDHYYGGGSQDGGDQNSYYGSSGGGSTPAPGYLPSYPRPVVTKTIQIAQPALKAKKFEIRHPAIQKEFYDIEERVVIKPAGTIVVELERPVAKIPKGETILPLGHPHPAVASAYNVGGQSVIQSVGAGDRGKSNAAGGGSNTQYSPSPVYTPRPTVEEPHPSIASTTIGSTLTTTPSYDQASKDDFVEANLNRQYVGEPQYVTTTERSYSDEQVSKSSPEYSNADGGGGGNIYVAAVDSNGHQRHIPSRHLSPNMFSRDESDGRYPSVASATGQVEVRNNGVPVVSRPQHNYQPQPQPQQQPAYSVQSRNTYNDNPNQHRAEFYGPDYYNGPQFRQQSQNAKLAKLQEEPKPVQTQIIKHEHNIVLPPSQHNIFLQRQQQQQQQQQQQPLQPSQLQQNMHVRAPHNSAQLNNYPRYNEEAARVLEVKPYAQKHPQTVVVYASTTARPLSAASGGSIGGNTRYNHYKNSQPRGNLQYSDSYSNMRYNNNNNNNGQYENARLTAADDVDADISKDDEHSSSEMSKKPVHVQIQVPHHYEEAKKPIVITSTIGPSGHHTMVHKEPSMSSRYRNSATQYNDNDNNYRRNERPYEYVRSANLETMSKPDCDYKPKHSAQLRARGQPQTFLRLVEATPATSSAEAASGSNVQHGNVDLNLKSSVGHMPMHGSSRVIAATPAPTDAAASSESFHKRRIVVNHPFQTVREVVEHEPITNYHHVQVHEPASPELYHHTAPYIQTHGALRQAEHFSLPVVSHQSVTHGHLHYAMPVAVEYH